MNYIKNNKKSKGNKWWYCNTRDRNKGRKTEISGWNLTFSGHPVLYSAFSTNVLTKKLIYIIFRFTIISINLYKIFMKNIICYYEINKQKLLSIFSVKSFFESILHNPKCILTVTHSVPRIISFLSLWFTCVLGLQYYDWLIFSIYFKCVCFI